MSYQQGLRLRDASTRQLETAYEQCDGDLGLLQSLVMELAQRPSTAAQALLSEIQVEVFRLEEGTASDLIDWDKVVIQHQRDAEEREARHTNVAEGVQKACAVLDTWMITETLTPQVFQTPEDLATRGVFCPLNGDVPWQGNTEAIDPNKAIFYQVFLGDVDVRDAHETLIDVYGANLETLTSMGSAVLAVATFNAKGILVGDYGVGVSCFPWSYARAREHKIQHLPFWQGAERLLIRRLRRKLSPVDEDQVPRPVIYEDLELTLQWLVDNLGLTTEEVRPVRMSVKIIQPAKRRPPSSPLLNSFLLNDLWRAKDAVLKGRAGDVLLSYMGIREPADHITHIGEVIDQQLNSAQLPLCCWPSHHGQGLDALQQTAVNIALGGQTDLFSVHGPPGTGKTTLLRDIIAGIMLQRAQVLVEFDDPEEAFEPSRSVKYGDQRLDVFPLDQRLLGHEIIVCSRNNKAVENISLELPMKREVSAVCDELDYFSETMQTYLDYKKSTASQKEQQVPDTLPLFSALEEVSDEDEPWGLMAAALGNGTNRRTYLRAVWLDEIHGLKHYFETMELAWENDEDESLFLPSSKDEAMQGWRDARTAFLEQQSRVQELLPEGTLDIDEQYQIPAQAELQEARELLFVLAMKLHYSFIMAAAPMFHENLKAFFRVIAGARGSMPELLPNLWATGAFITPVISTTFASVNRMLYDMPNNSIGWVLIDEAGQAAPQDAVGALMRAKRGIVVGDPQQIEPVVTVPDGLIQGIAQHHGLESLQWCAPEISVQAIADRVNPYGVAFNDGQVVGWPILVHRRCAEPMFSMINHMAYKGSMVRLTDDRQGHAQWIHVEGESSNKWSEEEGEKCVTLVTQLLQKSDEAIYIITPFRHCAQALRARFRKEKKLLQRLGIQDPSHWVRQSIGTVHTFQGRQAPRVIFVLGAQGQDEQGARHWATRKVNLCNVAVSRAQRALYIIGHQKLWCELGAVRSITQFLGPSSS